MTDKLPVSHFQALADLERSYWWHQHRFRLVHELLSKSLEARGNAPPRVADLGCGCGGFLEHLASQGVPNPIGFDYSETALRFTEEKGFSAYRFDFEERAPLHAAPYDALTALDLLEHVEHESAMLSIVRDSLRAGGTFVLTVPAFPHLYSKWDEHLRHHRRYSLVGLRALLNSHGFQVARISYFFSWVYPFAVVRMLKDRLGFHGGKDDEFPPVSATMNRTLLAIGGLERGLLRGARLPFGSSLVAQAVRI